MKLDDISVSALKSYDRNPRTHSAKQIKLISESIQEYGFTNPVLIDEHNVIIAGHGRLSAAIELKMSKVPCVRLSGLTEQQKKSYVIADNKLAAQRAGLRVRQCLIWVKNQSVIGRQDYHWQHEPVLYGYDNEQQEEESEHETILYGWKDGGRHKWLGNRKQKTVINWDKPKKNTEHPTMKPVGLVGYLIGNSCPVGGIVLDTFGGSGSTLIACEQIDRVCYICEMDEKYASVILQRFERLTGEKGVLLDVRKEN